MGKEIVFDYSKTAGFISEEEMKNMKSTVMGAKDVLTAKSGAGNDYLGWIDLPVDYDKEEFARIKKAAAKINIADHAAVEEAREAHKSKKHVY